VHRRDIDRGEEGGEVGVVGKEREVEDQKDEAILAAVVGERYGREATRGALASVPTEGVEGRGPVIVQRFLYDREGISGLRLHAPQSFRLDVFLKERLDLGV